MTSPGNRRHGLTAGVAALLGSVTLLSWTGIGLARAQDAQAEAPGTPPAVREEPKSEDAADAFPSQTIRVTVTAERIPQDLQDVPLSVAALTHADIRDAGVRSLADLAEAVPNLYLVNWGSRRNSFVYIRGIGSSRTRDSAVGLYVDEVALLNNGTFLTDLNDIERIEVLRGPQGTLYGRNTLGGVINVYTRAPDLEPELSLTAGFGNFASQEYRLVYRGPVVEDRAAVGVSLVRSTRDGYTDNDLLGTTVDDRDAISLRAQFLHRVSDRLSVAIRADADISRDGAFPLTDLTQVRQNPHHVRHDRQGFEDRDVSGLSVRVNLDGDAARLTSITALRVWDQDTGIDADFSPADLLLRDEAEAQTQLSQEIRLASPQGAEGLKWVSGLYFFHDESAEDFTTSYGADALALFGIPAGSRQLTRSDFTTDGVAVFGQATYPVAARLDLTAGVRVEIEEKTIDLAATTSDPAIFGPDFTVNASETFEQVSPRVSLAYHARPNLMTYVTVARGYKSGGFNGQAFSPADVSYDAEVSWNYELGVKSHFNDRRLTLNAAVFFIRWRDQQIVQTLAPLVTVIRNAGKSQSAGLELEAVARPVKGLQLTAGLGLVEAVFDEYDDPAAGLSYDKNRIPVSPEYNLNLAAQYRRALNEKFTLFSRLEFQGVGDFFWDDANSLKENAYQLVNVRLGLEADQWRVDLWGNNVLDEEYAAIAFQLPGFPAWGQAGAPPTFGLSVQYHF